MNQPDSSSAVLDLGGAIDRGAWSPYAKLVLAFAALAFCADGLANQVLALSVPALMKDWQLSRGAFAWVTATGLLGISVGAALAGVLGDRFGRRIALIGSVLLFGIMTAATAWADGMRTLGWLRVLAGLGLGGAIPNATSLIAEFTPLRLRSRAITIGMTFIPVGGMLSGLVAGSVLGASGWRTLYSIVGWACIVVTLLFIVWLPESPRYLLRRAPQSPALLRTAQRLGFAPPQNGFSVGADSGRARSADGAILGPAIRADTVTLCTAFFFAFLGLYSIFNWAPSMLASQGFDFGVVGVAMSAFGIGGIVGGFFGTWIIERAGSRVALATIFSLALVVALGIIFWPLARERGPAYTIGALAVQGAFLSGMQTLLIALAAHVYPASARATGVGLALSVGRLGAVASAFTGTAALSIGGVRGFFVSIGIAVVLSLLAGLLVRRHIERSVTTRA